MELRALLIRRPFVDWILDGKKTWELRGSATKVRGMIALVASGSGTVVGTCELRDLVGPLEMKDLRANAKRLNVPASQLTGPLYYRTTYAWVLGGAKRLAKPVPYEHPSGAVIWVRLTDAVARRVTSA